MPFNSARFGSTNGRINMNRLQCTGSEDNLLECGFVRFTVFDDHNEDAGVRCFQQCKPCFNNNQQTTIGLKYNTCTCIIIITA